MKRRTTFFNALRVFLGGWRLRWVRRAVWRRRVERLAVKRRRRVQASERTPRHSGAFLLEPLESRILLAADLTGVVQSAVLPNPALEGTTGSAVVAVMNQGDQDSNSMEVGVYLSQNTTLDASDVLIGTAASGSGVDAGRTKDFIVPFAISTQLDPGTYRLLAKVDNANATVENSETNNVALGGTLTVSWKFGAVAGQSGQTALTLRDADGTRATFSLTGPGTGEVVKNGSSWDVRLTGTNATSALTITTDAGGNGRLTLNEIDVAGSLASFTAPTTDLLGALTLNNGPLPVVNAGTIAGGVMLANAAPVAVADTVSVTEGGPAVEINVLANDTDANTGDAKTIVGWNAQGLQGAVTMAPNGSLIYSVGQAFNSLRAGATATETFTYTMADAAGETSTATVTVTIIGTNDGPVAQADSVTTQEGQAIAIAVLANDGDPDSGDTVRLLSIDSTGATGTTASGSINGVPMVYYTPRTQPLSSGQTTTDQFRYTIVDSAGVQSTATVTVTIVGVNNAPVAVSDSVTVTEDGGVITVNVLANDTDPDAGDTKTLTAVDGNGRPAQIVITSAPSSTFTTFIVIPEVPAIRGSVSIVDGRVQYDPTAVLQSLRAGETLTETIFYTVTDAAGAVSSSTLVVTVTGANDGPTAVADTVTIGKNAAPVSINVLGNDTDPDAGDTKTIVGPLPITDTDGNPLQGTVTQGPNGSLIYTVGGTLLNLLPGQTATETFNYTIQDSSGALSTTTVTVVITGENTAPVAAADTANATENGGPVTIDVLANDLDPETGQEKTVIGLNSTGLRGTVSIAPGGTGVIYTVGQAFQNLRAGETATETFTYTMADALGAQSTTTVTVTVTGVNDGPVAVVDSATLSEDAVPTTINVVANDTDADAGDTKQVVSLNTTGLIGTATISADGQGVIYSVGDAFQSLRAGQTVTERFTYTIRDGSGAVSTATVTITVTGTNDAPVANVDALTVTEDATNVTLAVLTNDTDADAGETKTIVAVDRAGLAGTVSIAANGGSLLYSAGTAFQSLTAGQTATETFTYTMRDRDGALSTATVTLTVTGVTDGPKAVADVVTAGVTEDGGSIVLDVLANDTNDANPTDQMTITSVDVDGQYSSPILGFFDGAPQLIGLNPGVPRTLGTVEIAEDGRSIIYTPPQSLNAGETLVDTFIYTMTDSNGQSSSSVVRVTVTGGANDAPTAVDDTANISADGGSVVIDVLANDTDLDTRVDPPTEPIPSQPFSELIVMPTPADVADTKTVVGVTNGLFGSAVISADGLSVIYTVGGSLLNLAFGQTETDTFTYTMRDAAGETSTATVTVTVTGTNQAQPVAEQPVAEQPVVEQPVVEQPVAEQPVVEQPVVEQPVAEQPVVEQPVVEQPVVEQPVAEQPVVEQPVVEQPVAEQPVVEQPVVEQPVAEQPVVEQPVVEQPVAEQPVVEQPVVEQPVVEQPVVEEPVAEQPVVEQPVAEQPVVEQPVVEQPVVEQPVVEQPVVEQPVVEQPVVEQPVAEQPVVEQPVAEQPVVEQPVVEQPVVEQPVAEQPVVEQPVVEQPVAEQPVVEQPVVEQPVVEQPVVEEPVAEQPVVEQPVAEQPVVEQPVVEQPVVEQPVAEQPVVEQPVAEQPVVEQPVVEQPVVEQPVVEQPVVEQPVVEQPVVEQPVAEQPVVEQPVAEQPVVEQPVVEQPVVEQPVAEQPVVEEPVAEQPVVEQPVAEQPVVEQPVAEQPVVEQPVVEQPVVEQPVVEQPVVEQPVVEQPVAEQPVVEQPVAEQPVVEQPVVEQPVVEQPVAEQPVAEQPVVEQPVVEQPVAEQPVVEQPVVEQPVAEQPVAEQPVVEQPVVEQPVAEQPVVEQPVVEEPVAEQPVVEQPVVEEPVAEQPVVEQPVAEQPVVEQPVVEQPVNNVVEEPTTVIIGTAGDDIITTEDDNDVIYGQDGDDTVSSGKGHDRVDGGTGRDTIRGGDGDDVLVGGADRDDLTGGAGADTFVYTQVSDSTSSSRDRIRDFSVAEGDKIDLRGIDANTSIDGDDKFVISTGFTGVAGELVLTKVRGGYLVLGDVDGDGVADFQIRVSTSDIIKAGDFML